MSHKNNDIYRNKPQFETNPTLNNNLTPDVPTFKSNAMDNNGFVTVNNCTGGCCGSNKDDKAHKKDSDYECCDGKYTKDYKHGGCHCNH